MHASKAWPFQGAHEGSAFEDLLLIFQEEDEGSASKGWPFQDAHGDSKRFCFLVLSRTGPSISWFFTCHDVLDLESLSTLQVVSIG